MGGHAMSEATNITAVGGVSRSRAASMVGQRVRGLSYRTVAWAFVTPTILLLLAINIFPLFWAIYLSFTNYRANKPGAPINWVGLQNYRRILNSDDIWGYLQVTAHFVFWSILIELLVGFGLAYLINKRFKGHALWTTFILLPMMLHPAAV